MSKIATEQDVYNVGKQGTPVANKCCTKKRMEALGCMGINGGENYANNRLIPEGYYTKEAYYVIHLSCSDLFRYTLSSGSNASYSQISDNGTLTITSNSDSSSITLVCSNKSGNYTTIDISGDASFKDITIQDNCSASIYGNRLTISNISSSVSSSALCAVTIVINSIGLVRPIFINF